MMTTTSSTIAALTCAAGWALASVLFSRLAQRVHPHALNLAKCAIATPLLLLTSLGMGRGFPSVTPEAGVALLVSSALGLALADTAYISALRRMGTRAVLFVPLVPVLTAVLAFFFLDEPLTTRSMTGMLVTLAGIAIVIRSGSSDEAPLAHRGGALLGLLYASGQAAANVLVKGALFAADPLHVATLRLAFGTALIFVMLPLFGGLTSLGPLWRDRKGLASLTTASVVGTYGGIWLGTIAIKGLPTGVATTLIATTPIWAMVLARALGEPLSSRAVLGAGVAVAGVALLAA